MQNKHQTFFSFFGGPTYGEGGGSASWAKSPTFSKNAFWGLPLASCRKSFLWKICEQYRELELLFVFLSSKCELHKILSRFEYLSLVPFPLENKQAVPIPSEILNDNDVI